MAYERVNPSHPDKIADRISGAIVDLCYTKSKNPKVACEVLIGHGECNIQVETSEQISSEDIESIVRRIAGEGIETRALIVPQDIHLAANQRKGVRCGDNGIFRGVPPTYEQQLLTDIAASIYEQHPYDGKYLIAQDKDLEGIYNLTVCQSHASNHEILSTLECFDYDHYFSKGKSSELCKYIINPLGPWTGGIDVDCGCTNRKLGSDMGDGVTGGGLNGKDLSKGDVSINIVCFLKAVQSWQDVTAMCSIGDENVTFQYTDGKTETEPFADVVEKARRYIMTDCGGFEKFSEWGLLRAKDI